MGHAKVSNTAFRTECCFPFLITKTTIQQRCPWPLHIYGGLREISLPPPWALITPGHSSLVTHWGHPAPVTAPGQQRQLGCSFTFQQLLQEEWWGRVRSGEVGTKWGAMRGWDGPRRGQVGEDLLSSLWPWAGLIQASPLCFLYPLGLSRAELPASSCTH